MRVHTKSLFGVSAVIGISAAVILLARGFGVFYNDTPSIPEGFWYSTGKPTPELGDYVALCPPDFAAKLALERQYLPAGRCPSGTVPLLKQVYATPFDLVKIEGDTLHVQHGQTAITHPVNILKHDHEGRPLTQASGGVLSAAQYWLGSPCPIGFDSRYFGAVPRKNIISVIQPLFTW
ncbi:MAG: conjugative transfer signal peptidase TraF [Halothiobacillus sp. 24-54-40]|jgi:conjugative transfer signal peptidase TraF|nr:MAG: conjugative transfer signal peptidase TraF [Halothiobacillus sp. 20-54-6]OYY32842.1 MAG: conjugative transfer signal peptidase TraF [Halothiobacillus sp. 35-54-62]OYZ85648.1 MAG: conjugative transfer signal peptidase TraF [Halothiobacillus sp. 24-54-40]OZA79434.1 MAG: conjugative transfer signal peptidase TraF [Halothiobacillus sp. 39-53-45]HQS03146.1 conjugative transfer signal peptidase TraF [Halothiobacillus sp.]